MQAVRWKQLTPETSILLDGEDQMIAMVGPSGTPGIAIAQDTRVNPFAFVGLFYSPTAAQKGAEKHCGVEASRLSFVE